MFAHFQNGVETLNLEFLQFLFAFPLGHDLAVLVQQMLLRGRQVAAVVVLVEGDVPIEVIERRRHHRGGGGSGGGGGGGSGGSVGSVEEIAVKMAQRVGRGGRKDVHPSRGWE